MFLVPGEGSSSKFTGGPCLTGGASCSTWSGAAGRGRGGGRTPYRPTPACPTSPSRSPRPQGGREAPEAPAASDVDGLEVGSVHLGPAYQLQTGEVVQVQVLEITESQHAFCFTRGCYLLLKLLIHGEDLPEITAAEYVDSLQNVGQELLIR